jgi:hypothetical protein
MRCSALTDALPEGKTGYFAAAFVAVAAFA